MTEPSIKKRLGVALVLLGGFAAFCAAFVLFVPMLVLPLLGLEIYGSIVKYSNPLFPEIIYLSLTSSVVAICILIIGFANRSWKILSNKLWLLGLFEMLFVTFVIVIVIVAAEFLPHR